VRRPRRARQRPRPLPLSAASLRAIERRGIARHGLRDLFYMLMTIRLSVLLALLAGSFLVVNVIFAGIYCVIGGLGGLRHGLFGTAFFFSVQTLSTTGYGAVFPVSVAANIVSVAEMLMGLMGTALATGVLFARLSRPQARVLFSNVVVVRPFQGVPTLMFRIVNERRTQIVEARISVTVTREEDDGDGGMLRRMVTLPLERETSPVFALSWLVMHRITPDSPLYGKDAESIADTGNVIICALSGTDDLLNANIYARHIYGAEHVRFGHRFVDVITRTEEGDMSIDYGRFHDTIAD
jgi:inward rectifier potassium channel